MASIKEYLAQILSARYGKDVRQAIHDSIQQCYYDGSAGTIDLEARQRLDDAEAEITKTKNELKSTSEILEKNKVAYDDIVDNLTSTATDVPLSANQGRVLKDELDDTIDVLNDLKDETIKIAFYDDAAENIGQLLDSKCAHARELNTPTVCIYGGWQNVDFGVFYAQVVNNVVNGIYVKGGTAYIVRCNDGTDTANYWEVATATALANTTAAAVKHTAYVESGVDLNTVTQSGFYRLSSGHVNTPSDAGAPCEWSQMVVMHGGGDTITQIISDYSTANLYTRSGNPSDTGGAGNWNAWRKIAMSDELANYLPLAGGTLTGNVHGNGGGIYQTDGNVYVNVEGYRDYISSIFASINNVFNGSRHVGRINSDAGWSTAPNADAYANASFVANANVADDNSKRAGYGFHNNGLNGIFLYLDADGRLKYINNSGGNADIITKNDVTVSGNDLILEWL